MVERRSRLSIYAIAVHDDAVLLCQISKGYPGEGKWTLPGGGVEWGEHPEEALVREVYEETGLSLESYEFLGILSGVFDDVRYSDQVHLTGLIYTSPLAGSPRVTEVDGSVCDVRWVPLVELANTPLVPLVEEGLKLADA